MGSFTAVVRDRPGPGLAALRAVVVLALGAAGCLGAAVARCQDGLLPGFLGLILGGGTVLVLVLGVVLVEHHVRLMTPVLVAAVVLLVVAPRALQLRELDAAGVPVRAVVTAGVCDRFRDHCTWRYRLARPDGTPVPRLLAADSGGYRAGDRVDVVEDRSGWFPPMRPRDLAGDDARAVAAGAGGALVAMFGFAAVAGARRRRRAEALAQARYRYTVPPRRRGPWPR